MERLRGPTGEIVSDCRASDCRVRGVEAPGSQVSELVYPVGVPMMIELHVLGSDNPIAFNYTNIWELYS